MRCFCGYEGEFGPVTAATARESMICPACGCTSRHRAVGFACAAYVNDARIYEVGHSRLTPLLRRQAKEVVVSEIQPCLGSVQQNLEALSFPSAYFDLAICSDVLEHVRLYRKAISELIRVLRPGGVLGLTVPFAPFSDAHYSFCDLGASAELDRWHSDAPVHSDPMNANGCKVYRTYGRTLLMQQLIELGLPSVLTTKDDIPEHGLVNSAVILGAKA